MSLPFAKPSSSKELPDPLASSPSSPTSPVKQPQPQQQQQQRQRASTAESRSSSASTSRDPEYRHHQSHPSDPFANAPATWYTPKSPGSSTFSSGSNGDGDGGGSPRSFYSAAAASSMSEAGHASSQCTLQHSPPIRNRLYDGNLDEMENDIGDVTITDGMGTTPRRWPSSSRKGKSKATHLDQYMETASYDGAQSFGGAEEEDIDEPNDDESRRVQENLKRWAEKEKLRRQKTRSHNIPTQRPISNSQEGSSDGFAAVTQLVRRMSTVGRSVTAFRPPHHHRKNSSRLQSLDSKNQSFVAEPSPFGDVEEVELQPQGKPQALRGASADSYGSIISQQEPPRATSQAFPERIQRAARTGSRFIEDLEDQEVLHSVTPGQSQPQSYAQLISPPITPAGSPSKPKGTPASRKRPFLRITNPRASSILSLDSQDPGSPHRPNPFRQSSGNTTPTLRSPTHSFPKQYYDDTADNAATHLVPRLRGSSDYGRQNSLDDDYESDSEVGWLQWILCCGCCSNILRGPDDEEQAGRTFPE